jgi:hypothetical protein
MTVSVATSTVGRKMVAVAAVWPWACGLSTGSSHTAADIRAPCGLSVIQNFQTSLNL